MFELDYLTQRLTFTRPPTSSHPRLIAGYAPTFEGDVVELPVATRRAARRGAGGVPRRRPRRATGPMVDAEDGRWAVAIADALADRRPREPVGLAASWCRH